MRAGVLVALLLAACTPDFEAASEVIDLRVLAVQAEPPEAQFDVDAKTVDPVHVRVLAVDPRDPSPITLRAGLCPPTDSRRCDEVPPLDLGTSLSLEMTVTAESDYVLDAKTADDLKGLGGIRVQYSFSVDHKNPGHAVYGSKVLIYSPRGGTPNHNPSMTGVRLSRAGEKFGDDVKAGDKLQLPRDVEIGLRPLLAEGASEQYTTTDLRGNPVTLPEYLRYSFFVAPEAEVDRDTADEPIDGVAPPDGLSRVTLRGASSTLWIVVRDGRGGESWLEFAVEALP
jgi:hypothetical protein